ncbi:hypothetical protein [Legionella feeleii]|uniref:Uncharacterized protein n=1 Tax=Legionella feeleii TaxID=453 RepID=A0A0W0U906_9GAMM|nr:hypothetical protein [Legionella feeleii]KTD04166.1 hypothetical protein Lfee_0254 [Legionella feeleii]SPX60722.1 Uncharacterised protein [Legionella feeleii]
MNRINNRPYLQIITFCGEAYHYLEDHYCRFNIVAYPIFISPDYQALIGAGAYFSPFTLADIDCRCDGLWDDLINEAKSIIFSKQCDLTPIVKFMQMGGIGYGYPTYRV